MHRSIRAILMGSILAGVAGFLLGMPLFAQHPNQHDHRALKEDPARADGPIAPVLEGLGDLHHPITTGSDRAQQFFDQGLRLTYGFNHQEALRAFKEAARLDADAAMAYWGWALVLGPNLNLPMRDSVISQAYEAMQMAVDRQGKVSRKEKDFIAALRVRYAGDPGADRAALDKAYARAMQKLHEKYPNDNEAATLYAASLMNLSPWDYWTRDGRPKGRTPEILATLEAVTERDPEHIGALHYYIHAVEPVDAKRGEWAADRLRGLTPGAGHLVHMPSHIYMQVGRYAESFERNRLAVLADEGYVTQCRAQGIYPLNYYPHNIHFFAWAAIMQGRSAAALDASRKVASRVPEDFRGNDWALYQQFLSMPLYTMVRFGKWPEILNEPRPPEKTRFWTGIWHYARGLAYMNSGKEKKAMAELEALTRIAGDPNLAEELVGFAGAVKLLTISREILEGEVAAGGKRFAEAIGHLDRAVRLEDALLYTEPPDWYYPVRHTLGAVLLQAGRPEEAEVVYWQDMRRYPENGYSLFGLMQSLKAQDRQEEAAEFDERYRQAWSDSDMKLTSSRF